MTLCLYYRITDDGQLLCVCVTELQKMGNDFVFGFIQSMDTEKDPRNLLMAFHCARTIILNFSLGKQYLFALALDNRK